MVPEANGRQGAPQQTDMGVLNVDQPQKRVFPPAGFPFPASPSRVSPKGHMGVAQNEKSQGYAGFSLWFHCQGAMLVLCFFELQLVFRGFHTWFWFETTKKHVA